MPPSMELLELVCGEINDLCVRVCVCVWSTANGQMVLGVAWDVDVKPLPLHSAAEASKDNDVQILFRAGSMTGGSMTREGFLG